jgi:hypothetical protein
MVTVGSVGAAPSRFHFAGALGATSDRATGQ